MNGIGLVIPGADFSGSPLGKVTVAISPLEVATEIINAFVEETHATDTDALLQLVVGLIENDLWDKLIAFFPMIGNTIDAKLVDLKNPSRSAWKGANFTSTEKGIHIANDIDAGKPSSDLWYETCPFVGFSMSIACYTDASEGINAHSAYSDKFYDYSDGSTLFTINPNSLKVGFQTKLVDSRLALCFGRADSIVVPPVDIVVREPHRYTAVVTSGRRNLLSDGQLTYDEKSTNYQPLSLYPIIGVTGGNVGGTQLSINDSDEYNSGTKIGSRALDGEVYAFGFGNFKTIEQATLFDTIFGTFLHDSGKIL